MPRGGSVALGLLARTLLAAVALPVQGSPTAAADIAANVTLRNIHIVDPVDGSIARNRVIEIRNGMVVSIRRDRGGGGSATGLSIDGAGSYAIPGLWDSHVHILQGGMAEARRDAARLLAHGITHARDMGSGLEAVSAFRADPGTDEARALHLLAAGPTLWTFELPYGDQSQKRLVRTPAEIGTTVDSLAGAGVDLIKPYAGFDAGSLGNLVAAAQRHRIPVAGHAQSGLTLEEHARIGVSSIEHFDFSSFQECAADSDSYFQRVIASRFRNAPESIPAIYAAFADAIDPQACRQAMRRAGAAGRGNFAIVPTLHVTFLPEQASRAALAALPADRREPCELYLRQFDARNPNGSEQLRQASQRLMTTLEGSGIAILAGTDAPAFCAGPGAALSQELRLLHEAGLSPIEVLRAATLMPARHFGFGKRFGRILTGRPADLVLLSGDPLKSLEAYERPVGVLARGRWWSKAELNRLRTQPQAGG